MGKWKSVVLNVVVVFVYLLCLQVLFSDKIPTCRALDIISCFSVVSSHASVKKSLDKCMVAAFTRYGLELEEFQHIYERDKVSITEELIMVLQLQNCINSFIRVVLTQAVELLL